MLRHADAAIGAKVTNMIKKDDFGDEVENILQMS